VVAAGSDVAPAAAATVSTGITPASEVAPTVEVTPLAVAAPISSVPAPVSAVVVWIQNLLISVFGAGASPAQLQSDVYSFLLGLARTDSVVNEFGGDAAAANAPVTSQLRLALLLNGVLRMPLPSNTLPRTAFRFETLGGIATSIICAMSEAGRALSLPGLAPSAAQGYSPMGARWSYDHAQCNLPLAASVWTLAAVALPGVGGLVILLLGGVRIGYRQAKAGFALQATGIARFARPGPLGVVPPTALHVVRSEVVRIRPEASSARYLLGEAA
jgi:hypothetical protein